MLDHFLTTVLKVIIAIDVVSAVAYILLGGLKRREPSSPEPVVAPPASAGWRRWPWRRRGQTVLPTSGDWERLRQVLYGFQQGLV